MIIFDLLQAIISIFSCLLSYIDIVSENIAAFLNISLVADIIEKINADRGYMDQIKTSSTWLYLVCKSSLSQL